MIAVSSCQLGLANCSRRNKITVTPSEALLQLAQPACIANLCCLTLKTCVTCKLQKLKGLALLQKDHNMAQVSVTQITSQNLASFSCVGSGESAGRSMDL